ncbi:HAD family hydrolase [Streptomyces sp. NRRL F-5135]|uniref:HAD family hydrolase n=1 Tax=Streptomyces sp. NRRL F-5135 TaxID=1463858 RepID=UPI0018FE07CB|nr:HAD family hydrolase [Streptomyces sp. NRRL F-5135]
MATMSSSAPSSPVSPAPQTSQVPLVPQIPPESQVPLAPQAFHVASGSRPAPTVGFDLDMTLIDSRPGIHAAYRALSAETGTHIDADLAVTRLGPPLEVELAHWFPEERIAAMSDRYREIYPTFAIAPTLALPGAREAIAAVQALGGRAVVVTAKHEPNAKLHLSHLGIEPDAVVGWLWAEAKGGALREHGATVYVGDHTGDVRGARTAGALSVAVPTGPCDAEELRAAGADVVLPDLTAFPAWLDGYVAV